MILHDLPHSLSRVTKRLHTLSQTLAGAVCGSVVAVITLSLEPTFVELAASTGLRAPPLPLRILASAAGMVAITWLHFSR